MKMHAISKRERISSHGKNSIRITDIEILFRLKGIKVNQQAEPDSQHSCQGETQVPNNRIARDIEVIFTRTHTRKPYAENSRSDEINGQFLAPHKMTEN